MAGGIDNYTKLLLHMNESPLVDSSISAHTVTMHADAARSATRSKFGGYSCYFDGVGDYISVPDSDDFDFGTGDFTIDFWFNDNNTSASYPSLIGNEMAGGYGSGGFNIRFSNSGYTDKITVHIYGDEPMLTSTTTFNSNEWHHVAVCRSGGTAYLFIDGDLEDTDSMPETLDLSQDSNVVIGDGNWDGANSNVTGYFDELRISKGIARWTTSFTPPTEAYTFDYKISGSLGDDSRIFVIDESDWSLETYEEKSAGSYEIYVVSGTKTVLARKNDGEVVGYGDVTPISV